MNYAVYKKQSARNWTQYTVIRDPGGPKAKGYPTLTIVEFMGDRWSVPDTANVCDRIGTEISFDDLPEWARREVEEWPVEAPVRVRKPVKDPEITLVRWRVRDDRPSRAHCFVGGRILCGHNKLGMKHEVLEEVGDLVMCKTCRSYARKKGMEV